MPRTRRLIVIGAAMHIMCRGNGKRIVFNNVEDKEVYYKLLLKNKAQNFVPVLHYSLMNNHVHLVTMPSEQSNVSKFIQQVNLGYMVYFRMRYGLCGHLWQGRYKSSVIDTEQYLLQCGKYVELDPVRAGIVTLPEYFRFSSYNAYANGKFDPLITYDFLYERLDTTAKGRQEKYTHLVLDDKIFNKETLSRTHIVGSDRFKAQIEEKIKKGTHLPIFVDEPKNWDLSPV